MTAATATLVAKKLATGNFGYGQDDRTSALADNGKMGVAGLREPGDTDCSFSVGIIYYLAGFIDRSVLRGTFYTGNIAIKLKATGMYKLIRVSGWSLARLKADARECDAIVGPNHVVYALGGGKCVSFEVTEKGTSTGGAKGDQTGKEGRIRDLYARSRGWTYIIRPYTPAELAGQLVGRYAAGQSTSDAVARVVRRSPYDGPLWAAFMASWAKLDRGMMLAYTADQVVVPSVGHAYVVLGSGLKPDGTMPAKMLRRLKLAKAALDLNPTSKVVVSGGKLKAGVTEAGLGRDWLISQGIGSARIITEDKSSSTIGNARLSVAALRKAGLSSYTLVSDASHLRRASILFLTAILKIETAENKRLGLAPTTPVAFDDYAPAAVKTSQPVTAATRATIAAEVRSLLGV